MSIPKNIQNYIDEIIEKELEKIRHHAKQRVTIVLTTTINNFQIRVMAVNLSLAANQSSQGILGLVDNTSGNPVPATFSGVGAVPSDATIFSATVNPDNTITVKGVAAGTGTLNITATASYTDSNTGQPATTTQTISVAVTVTPVVTPEGVTLNVTFSTPQ